MKNRIVLLFLVLVILILGKLSMQTSDTAQSYPGNSAMTMTYSLADLVIIPQLEIPQFMTVPEPTPTIYIEDQITTQDSRSWTKSVYKKYIRNTADKYDIDPQVVYATIMTESEGDPFAFRYEPHLNDASLGLGQILTQTAKKLGFQGDPRQLYNPEIAIDLIGRYHKSMIDEYGTLTPNQLAIAYNTGSPYGQPYPRHLTRFTKWLSES